MPAILSAGLLIGVLCGAWTFVMGFTGWYKDPTMLNLFFVVILIEIGGLIWGLRKTALEGRTYGGQIVAGTIPVRARRAPSGATAGDPTTARR